jgi:SAM-dependent methyltransferase
MNLRDTYNKIAKDWHKTHQSNDWWVNGTDKFISLLKPGSFVLDVGCGGGNKSGYLMDRGLKVFGIDFAEEMVAIAKKENPDAEFAVVDLYEIEKLNKKFDGVFMQAVLLHIPRKEAPECLRKAVSILKPDGLLYVAVKGKKDNGIEEEIKTEKDYGYEYQRFFSYFSLDEIKTMFKKIGLEVVYETIEFSGRSNWVQVIGKKQ